MNDYGILDKPRYEINKILRNIKYRCINKNLIVFLIKLNDLINLKTLGGKYNSWDDFTDFIYSQSEELVDWNMLNDACEEIRINRNKPPYRSSGPTNYDDSNMLTINKNICKKIGIKIDIIWEEYKKVLVYPISRIIDIFADFNNDQPLCKVKGYPHSVRYGKNADFPPNVIEFWRGLEPQIKNGILNTHTNQMLNGDINELKIKCKDYLNALWGELLENIIIGKPFETLCTDRYCVIIDIEDDVCFKVDL